MIELSPLPTIAVLESMWRHLAAGSAHSFFLSWQWTSTWLHCVQPRVTPMLLTVSVDKVPVAAALVVKTTIWRRSLMPVQTLVLNATGVADLDSIYIGYNGLLASPEHARTAWSQVVDYFRDHHSGWDEFRLEAVPPWMAEDWARNGLPVRQVKRDVSRYLDLEAVRTTRDQSCLSLLRPRARTTVRHTLAAITTRLGAVRMTAASTTAEALQFLDQLKILHCKKWAETPTGGAFRQPFFERFHRELITRHFQAGAMQMLRVDFGDTTLGYLYNFIHQGRVLFYQSGVDYDAAHRGESVGLLMQALAIDYNAELGHAQYDMLAGDSQYKRTFASETTDLWWGELQTQRVKLRAEKFTVGLYRAARRRIQRLTRRARPAGA